MSHLESVFIWIVVLFLAAAEFGRWRSPKKAAPSTPAVDPSSDVARQIIDEVVTLRDEAKKLRDYIELRRANLAAAETKILDRATEAICGVTKKYETDIRRMRDLAATQQRSIDRLNDLSRRDYKADVEAGVFEHLAVLARDRANTLADKKEL